MPPPGMVTSGYTEKKLDEHGQPGSYKIDGAVPTPFPEKEGQVYIFTYHDAKATLTIARFILTMTPL